jgi:tRNA threonylcarbamoyladenosine biosynthesis protein TsaB
MLLAIETSDRLCAACVLDTKSQKIVASQTLDIGKGHAERLMDVISDVLGAAGIDYTALTSLAVCVGPGSFTGIRAGLAAAIGISIACNIPLVGVTSLQAVSLKNKTQDPLLCMMDAKRGDVYVQNFSSERQPLDEARQMHFKDVTHMPELSDSFDLRILPDVVDIAHAALNPSMCVVTKPLYLRNTDAQPQKSYTLSRLLRS